jgi:hypothetical protein
LQVEIILHSHLILDIMQVVAVVAQVAQDKKVNLAQQVAQAVLEFQTAFPVQQQFMQQVVVVERIQVVQVAQVAAVESAAPAAQALQILEVVVEMAVETQAQVVAQAVDQEPVLVSVAMAAVVAMA